MRVVEVKEGFVEEAMPMLRFRGGRGRACEMKASGGVQRELHVSHLEVRKSMVCP